MTQQTKRPNLLPYLLVLLVLVGVYGFMNKPVEAEPSYAEVRELFESEQVSAFTVTDTTLRMKLREPIDGKTELKKDLFSVTLFYDDLGELIEQQKADGIIEDYDFTADHSINYVRALYFSGARHFRHLVLPLRPLRGRKRRRPHGKIRHGVVQDRRRQQAPHDVL